MKKTLLVGLLSIVCAVACAFGLTACNNDKEVVVKEGKTTIGDVKTEAASYKLEGTVGNYYNLVATVNGEACMDVLLKVGPSTQGEGSVMQFLYYQENLTVTVKSTTESTIKNVVLELTKTDAPVVPTEYEEINLSETVVPEFPLGESFVTYKLVVADSGPYKVTGNIFLGDIQDYADIAIGPDLDNEGKVDLATKVDIDYNEGTMDLEAGTYYVTAYAEDSFMIVLNISSDNPEITVDDPVTIESLGTTPVMYEIAGAEVGTKYKVTATVSDVKADSVRILVGQSLTGDGEVEFTYGVATGSVSVSFVPPQDSSATVLENVVLTIEEVEEDTTPDTNPVITLDQPVTATGASMFDPVIYELTITTAGTYQLKDTSIDPLDVVIGDDVEGGEVIQSAWFGETGYEENEVYLAAGNYYVAVCDSQAFTLSLKPAA